MVFWGWGFQLMGLGLSSLLRVGALYINIEE